MSTIVLCIVAVGFCFALYARSVSKATERERAVAALAGQQIPSGVSVPKPQPMNGGYRAASGPGSQIIGALPCHACGCGNCTYTNWNNCGQPTAIQCEGCGAATQDLPTLSAAVLAWNRGELVEQRDGEPVRSVDKNGGAVT